MGAKKKNENEKNGDGGKKKEDNPINVVLKVDMHCEGCATKIIKCVKAFEGVQTVKAEFEGNKLTVLGKIDPLKLREKLATKTKKKVDLISPQQPNKKEKDSKNPDDNDSNNKSDKKSDDKKKPKEPLVITAVLKVGLHCRGCIEKIHKVTSKFKGVQEMSVDKQKDLLTVRGTMDVKALITTLIEKLKRPVEIVTPKKEKENDTNEGNRGENTQGAGGGKKKKKGGNGGGGGDGDGGEVDGYFAGGKFEGNKMEYIPMVAPGYGYGYGFMYGYGYGPGGLVGEHLHAPQIFSDENPNACSIM